MAAPKKGPLVADRHIYIRRDTGEVVGPGLPDAQAYLLAATGHLIPPDVVERHHLKMNDEGHIEQHGDDADEAGREPDMDAEKPGEFAAADPDKRAALEAAGDRGGDLAAGAPKQPSKGGLKFEKPTPLGGLAIHEEADRIKEAQAAKDRGEEPAERHGESPAGEHGAAKPGAPKK